MYKRRLLISVFLISILSSCIREVEYVFDDDTLTAITCIMEHGRAPVANVFNTNSVYDSLPSTVLKDASVFITRSDGETYELKFDFEINAFISSDIVLEERSYDLEVRILDEVYTSNTTIPSGAEIYNAIITHGQWKNEYGDDLTHYEITLMNDPSEVNYYQMFLLLGDSNPYIQEFGGYYNINNPVLVSESLLEYGPEFFLFTDTSSAHGMIKIELNGFFCLYNGKPCTTQLVVRSVSKEYYEFLRSWIVHSYNQNNGQHVHVIDDLDPYRIFFQGQSVDLYSNIDNGVGVFGAYTESRKFFTYVE